MSQSPNSSHLLKYLVVNIDDGKWEWNKDTEHPSLAVPKMLNTLELRIKKLLNDLCEEIKKGIFLGVFNPNKASYEYLINEKFEDTLEEFNLHIFMLNDFYRKVMKSLEEEKGNLSPIIQLKNMDAKLSPLINKKNKTSLTTMYEHYDNEEISVKIEDAITNVNNLIKDITLTKECFYDLFAMNEIDAFILLEEMRKLRNKMEDIKNEQLFNTFFLYDDAVRGLIRRGISIKYNLAEVADKLSDLIFRTILKVVNNYRKTEESLLVDKAVDRLKDLKLDTEDLNIQCLLELKSILEVEPKHPSLPVCYKKIGEIHASFHQKMFELSALKYLRKYFSVEMILLVDIVLNYFTNIHKAFCNTKECATKDNGNNVTNANNSNNVNNDDDSPEKSLQELEIYSSILQELLLEADIGKVYFFLNKKLHQIYSVIAQKYHKYNSEEEKKLFCFLKILSEESFRHFVQSLQYLMVELRKEVQNNKEIDPKDLNLIGIVTGKTSMIDNYGKAIEEILASMGTFIGNTLNALVKEIIQNLDYKYSEERSKLLETYNTVTYVLKEFNRESLSNSE